MLVKAPLLYRNIYVLFKQKLDFHKIIILWVIMENCQTYVSHAICHRKKMKTFPMSVISESVKLSSIFLLFFSQKVIKSVNKMSVIIYSTLKTKQTEYRANFYTNSRKISAYYTVRVSAKMRTVFTMLFLNLILVIKRTWIWFLE